MYAIHGSITTENSANDGPAQPDQPGPIDQDRVLRLGRRRDEVVELAHQALGVQVRVHVCCLSRALAIRTDMVAVSGGSAWVTAGHEPAKPEWQRRRP
jgi:hypothetical protein